MAQPQLVENICIPIHLDAFALSPSCADGPSKLAPYTQPDYLGLRMVKNTIQNDVLDHVDFHLSSSSTKNLRFQDLGSQNDSVKLHRLGVHLHWSLPRFYRSAISTAQKSTQPSDSGSGPDASQPMFPAVPNRWLVIRDLQSCEPVGVLPRYQGWIIESDVVRNITDIPPSVDLQSDATPFVSYDGKGDKIALETQAEIFLGQKYDLIGWAEQNRHYPKLTVMNSTNPLFPDYALHNTNVMSMIDNFQYRKSASSIDYCTEAKAHYYVLGWHSNKQDDPFVNVSPALGGVLSQLKLRLDTSDAGAARDSKLGGSTRCMNHGAIYNVMYDRASKPTSVADQAALKFIAKSKTEALAVAQSDMEPLAVGTTTMDAILTFLKAHRTHEDSFFKLNDPNSSSGSDVATEVAKDLLQISSLLYATADEYDARLQATDLITHQNYTKTDGGVRWRFNDTTKPGDSPLVPSDDLARQLRGLNAQQAKLDACRRKLRSTQWDLFAEWWKFVSRSFDDAAAKDAAVKGPVGLQARVRQLVAQYDTLNTLQTSLTASIKRATDALPVQKASNDAFHQRLDPTLCVAGIDPGRPKDFMDVLQVMEDHQLVQDTTSAAVMFKDANGKAKPTPSPEAWPFPADNQLHDTGMKLLAACMSNLGTENTSSTTGYRSWGAKNPFVPLFLEWEATYYHIDRVTAKGGHDAWDVAFRASPVDPQQTQLRWFPKDLLSLDASYHSDARALSGRILVLPQPTFNLEATVEQILDGTNPDMSLTSDQVEEVRQNIRNMQFISAPLSGLTNHLLTRCEGAHVKTSVRSQGQTTIPLQAAVDAAGDLSYTIDILKKIDAETALTPYGTLTDFTTDRYPFKPVTQGQLIFTKLNIVDKFGQAICVPTPKPRRRDPRTQPPANIYPCLSDYLTPDIRGGKLNTVFELSGAEIGGGDPGKEDDPNASGTWPLCQYVQLTPSINQDARMVASFLVPDDNASRLSPWRAATDYEQPVWGWIVVNYADCGLQFFHQSGAFYQEVRMGGANHTNIGPKDRPFSGDSGGSTSADKQLDQLIALFKGNSDYLQAFFDMINGAIRTMPFAPADYAAYATSIVGKPLALVNIGYSLELAAPAIIAQNTLGKSLAQESLHQNILDPAPAYQTDLESYEFPVKFGDSQRSYDGVVGYYEADNTLAKGGQTDWTVLHTYFGPTKAISGVESIDRNPYPLIKPHYLQPEKTDDFALAAATKYQVRTAVVDPYTPAHIYSPILPSVSLQLPSWTVQTAMKRMDAFFHLGPSLLTQDVPATAFSPTTNPDVAAVTTAPPSTVIEPTPMSPTPPSILLPLSGGKGTWSWLQPYAVPKGGVVQKPSPTPESVAEPTYSKWPVDQDHGQVKFAAAPYTFVEGFLQLAGDLAAAGKQAP